MLEYRLPSFEDETALAEYVAEHHTCGENSVGASLGLPVMPYKEWVERIHANASVGDGAWGRSLLYLCFEKERIVGLLSIRYELTEELSQSVGDIGYGVRPTERRKGYGTRMLRHALTVCEDFGKTEVILGCYKDNVGSAGVIRACGGRLIAENDNFTHGRTSTYYRITVVPQQRDE